MSKMIKVRVIAAQGASLRGPAQLTLSADQHKRRASVLGPARKKGVYPLEADQALNFKFGEEFGVSDFEGRLNVALFEDVEAAAKIRAAAKIKAAAKPVAPDTDPGPGDDGPGDDDVQGQDAAEDDAA